MSTVLDRLQAWYSRQCDGEWEHHDGLVIGTLDNPGWQVRISIAHTYLSETPFERVSYGVGADADASGDEWLLCRREGPEFAGYGGPAKLGEILGIFLDWAEQHER